MTAFDSASVQAFFFRAATATGRVEEMVERNELLGPTAASSDSEEALTSFSYSIRVEAGRMARTYELLFCFENSVRELIEDRLKEAYGVNDWWTKGVSEEIRQKAERLSMREQQAPWHSPRGGTLLAFVDFPILASIITDGWEHFEDLLGKTSWVVNVFEEMNQSRRAIAHTGVLAQHDIERMELRVRDWLRAVG